jgi:glyoxylase-like metal-dependent hydrolase (beta-lactamase superfamily II)
VTEPQVVAAQAGIHMLRIPTPFAVGRVNCYLIDDDPLTLVDTGPNSGTSLDTLERALAEHGRRIEDLELIVLSHQHMDHSGLLQIIVRRSGARVATLDRLAPWLAGFPDTAEQEDRYAAVVMRRNGVPDDTVRVLEAVGAAFRAYGSRAEVTDPLSDGGLLSLRDRELRVLHRPGHSPSDTLLWDERRGILLTGDHLLAQISSNPLITLPLEAAGWPGFPSGYEAWLERPRPRPLPDYVASLKATQELPASLVLGGHGDAITDHVTLIDERLRGTERRVAKILELLSGEPQSAHELALKMWGHVAVTQALLTVSEVLGHVDLLVERGQVVQADNGSVIRYVAV